jgi:hypothetical protein
MNGTESLKGKPRKTAQEHERRKHVLGLCAVWTVTGILITSGVVYDVTTDHKVERPCIQQETVNASPSPP